MSRAKELLEKIDEVNSLVGREVFFPTRDRSAGHMAGRGGYIEKVVGGKAYVNFHDNSNEPSMWVPLDVAWLKRYLK